MKNKNETWLPQTAGVLDIAVGTIILGMLFLFAIAPLVLPAIADPVHSANLSFDVLFLIAPGLIVGELAVFGGICALKRKRWGWALAGSIAAALNPLPLGMVAIVLVVLSKKEFM